MPSGLANVTAIASGTNFHLALLSNTTVIAWGANGSGQTNLPGDLSNVVAVAAGGAHALALKSDGAVISWGDNWADQTNVPQDLTNAMAIAAGGAHSVALRNDGTVVAWGDNTAGQTNLPAGWGAVKLIAAGGDFTLTSQFSPLVQYQVDVTKDLLLIYNSNSTNSIFVKDYYLANRPMVSGANVLPVACAADEVIAWVDLTNQIIGPLSAWFTINPTKRPTYVILFLDLPSLVQLAPMGGASVSYTLHTNFPGWQPFVTHINLNGTNDCKAYIDKLESMGTNFPPSRLLISARSGGYGNTNYYFDDASRRYPELVPGEDAMNSVIQHGIPALNVTYVDANQHITYAADVAGYLTWGANGGQNKDYATNGDVVFAGSSTWYIIETIESYNGAREDPGQGTFIKWFSPSAFGGTSYANTPVGAVTHVAEPLGGWNDSALYFGLWASNKNFAICAWNSLRTEYLQAVGDPFTTR